MHTQKARRRRLPLDGLGAGDVSQIRYLVALYTVASLIVASIPVLWPQAQGWITLAILSLTALILVWGFVAWPGMALAQAATAAMTGDLLQVQTLWGSRQITLAELHRVRHLLIKGRYGNQAFLTLIDSAGHRVVLNDANYARARYGRSDEVDDAVRNAILRGLDSGDLVVSSRALRALAERDTRFGRRGDLPGSATRDALVTALVCSLIPLTLFLVIATIYATAFDAHP